MNNMATSEAQVQSDNINGTEFTTAMKYLKDYFHYENFKSEIQKNVISKIVKRESDVFVSIPKEGGRSLCYQLPALVHSPKITIVFCPSESRIKKHIDELACLEIKAKTIKFDLPREEHETIYRDFLAENTSAYLLYLEPQIAFTEEFNRFLKRLVKKNRLAYIVIDEAYFEIDWVYGLKIDYRVFGKTRSKYSNIPWIVTTSIASDEVIVFLEQVLELKIEDPGYSKFSPSYFLPNLCYEVVLDDVLGISYGHVMEFINECLKSDEFHQPTCLSDTSGGLIYCKTKEKCEEIAVQLGNEGLLIASFHAGLKDDEQHAVYNAFMAGEYQVLTVTSCFGMKIQEKNLKFVVHWGLPLNMFNYYLETRMAGDKGTFVRCRIYSTKKSIEYFNEENELNLKRMFHKSDDFFKIQNTSKAYLMFTHSRYMKDYCESEMCRHSMIVDYFGQEKVMCGDKCDTCVALTEKYLDDNSLLIKFKKLKLEDHQVQ